jgi:hypothetical protein
LARLTANPDEATALLLESLQLGFERETRQTKQARPAEKANRLGVAQFQ